MNQGILSGAPRLAFYPAVLLFLATPLLIAETVQAQNGDDFMEVECRSGAYGTVHSRCLNGVCRTVATNCSDRLTGGDEDDVLRGYGGRDLMDGGFGDDRLEGGKGGDNLDGGEGNDVLLGGKGGDVLLGGDGDDRLLGGKGNDHLSGGPGNDVMTGGAGADTFEYEEGYYVSLGFHRGTMVDDHGSDTITDFEPGKDQIWFFAGTARGTLAGISFDSLSLTADGDDTILDLSDYGGGQIRFEDVAPEELAADDFVIFR